MSTDFSSIDKLMEFGLGISLAQQMVNTMNHAMSNNAVPGVNAGTTGQTFVNQTAVPPKSELQWYAVIDNLQVGPLSSSEIKTLVQRGKIVENTLVWRAGMTAWQLAKNIPEINKIIILG